MEITLLDLPKISTNKIYAGVHIEKKIELEFIFYFKSRVLDSSNCSYMGKLLEDCLVAHGVLQDDTIKYVDKVSYQSLRGNQNKTIIKII
jgi:hypothetical protein